jgi:hypothetical protein
MTITDIVNETISEIAIERKINEDLVTWHNIAIRLAQKIKKI